MAKLSPLSSPIEKKSHNFVSSYLVAIAIILSLVFLVGLFFLEFGRVYYTDKSAPSQFFESSNISGISSLEAQTYISSLMNKHLKKEVEFLFNDKSYLSSYLDLGAKGDFNLSYNQIKFYKGKPTRSEFLRDQFNVNRYYTKLNLDIYDLEEQLTEVIPATATPRSAAFAWDALALVIKPERIGNKTNFAQIRQQVLTRRPQIEIPFELQVPTVLSIDLEPIATSFEQMLATPITLNYKDKTYTINLAEDPTQVIFSHGPESLLATLDPAYLSDFLTEKVAPELESEPETLSIQMKDKGKAEFDKVAKSGFQLDLPKIATSINDYLTKRIINKEAVSAKVALSLVETPPILVIDPALQEKGIKELVSVGYTTFHGSPANRIHNIKVGTEIYNGMIIPKGETFSFNKALGPVDGASGYLPELVIKAEGTIPEYGGGICQVSTTMYRGVLLGGIKVSERYNHSYTVGYYAQVLGHGLDATIYPGSKDFQFQNDTPGDLLMQAFVEGTTMTFRFYGTNDNRSVELIGPKILSQTAYGSPVYVVKPELAPGYVSQVQKAVPGLSTEWTRKITYQDGTVVEEPIISRFRAVAPKYVTGPAAGPTI